MTKRLDLIEAAELAVHIMCAFPKLSGYSAADRAVALLSLERAARRHAERECSEEGYNVEAGRVRLQRQANRWTAALSELAMLAAAGASAIAHASAAFSAGVRIEFQGDPRGCCLLLMLPGRSEPLRV